MSRYVRRSPLARRIVHTTVIARTVPVYASHRGVAMTAPSPLAQTSALVQENAWISRVIATVGGPVQIARSAPARLDVPATAFASILLATVRADTLAWIALSPHAPMNARTMVFAGIGPVNAMLAILVQTARYWHALAGAETTSTATTARVRASLAGQAVDVRVP